jgi:hypothetical protein
MDIDFFSDLSGEIQTALLEFGLNVPSLEQLRQQDKRSEELKAKYEHYDLFNLLHHFFTVYTRRVPVRKWNVHISDKLLNSIEIIAIIDKLRHGYDVNLLLSNRIRKLNQSKFADLLLAEWGIHHFHFAETRSNELLFIFFSENDAYLIDILQHEKADGSIVTWTNTDLIQVMHDNWPNLLAPYISNINSQSPILTTEDRKTLRNKAVNTTIIVKDGTEYMPIGGGYSASQHPVRAIVQSEILFQKVKQLQAIVEENSLTIQHALSKLTSCPKLELKLTPNLEPIVIEVVHKVRLNFTYDA